MAKVTPEIAGRVRWLYWNSSCSVYQVGAHYGISASTVNNILEKKGRYGKPPFAAETKPATKAPVVPKHVRPKHDLLVIVFEPPDGKDESR